MRPGTSGRRRISNVYAAIGTKYARVCERRYMPTVLTKYCEKKYKTTKIILTVKFGDWSFRVYGSKKNKNDGKNKTGGKDRAHGQTV